LVDEARAQGVRGPWEVREVREVRGEGGEGRSGGKPPGTPPGTSPGVASSVGGALAGGRLTSLNFGAESLIGGKASFCTGSLFA
jgi:hypothetical protein